MEEPKVKNLQQEKPIIKIIGEIHDNHFNKEFTDNAKKLAKNGEIILVLENEVFDDYENGLIENNIYAIEDKVIWEYFGVINALYEIFPIIKVNEEFKKGMLEIFKEMQSLNITENDKLYLLYKNFEETCNKTLQEYTKSYCAFLCNTKERNPVSQILLNFLSHVIADNFFKFKENENPFQRLYSSIQNRKEKKQYDTTDYEIRLVSDNLNFFNEGLKISAELFITYILEVNYFLKIKNHLGLSQNWINDYFQFKLIRTVGETLLDTDAVCVDLRNQLFVERLAEISNKNNQNKEIWFIVGEDHLKGLNVLFSENEYSNFEIYKIQRDQKQDLIENFKKSALEEKSGEKQTAH